MSRSRRRRKTRDQSAFDGGSTLVSNTHSTVQNASHTPGMAAAAAKKAAAVGAVLTPPNSPNAVSSNTSQSAPTPVTPMVSSTGDGVDPSSTSAPPASSEPVAANSEGNPSEPAPTLTAEFIQTTIQSAIAPLNDRIIELQNTNTELATQLETERAKNGSLEAQNTSQSAELNNANSQVSQLSGEVDTINQQLTAAQAQEVANQAAIDALKQAVADNAEQAARINNVLGGLPVQSQNGAAAPNQSPFAGVGLNTQSSPHDEMPQNLSEFYNAMQYEGTVLSNASGTTAKGYNPTFANQIFNHYELEATKHQPGRSYMPSRNNVLLKEMDKWARANGLLNGSMYGMFKNAAAGPTTGGSAPDAYLDMLSTMLRASGVNTRVWHNFATPVYDSSATIQQNILVPRIAYGGDATNLADYVLSTSTTHTSIGVTTGTATDSQGVEVSTVPIPVVEYGIGKGDNLPENAPIFLPQFHRAITTFDFMMAVNKSLFRNYRSWEDLLIRSQYELTSQFLYWNAATGSLTATPGDIVSGGQFDEQLFISMHQYMYGYTTPVVPFDGGFYAAVLSPSAFGQLKSDMLTRKRHLEKLPLETIVNQLLMSMGNDEAIEVASSYQGTVHNIHVFNSNTIGVGASAAASTTITDVTYNTAGGGTTIASEHSYFFGAGAVGRGISSPMTIRANVAPYQRGEGFIWTEWGGAGPLDVDAAIVAPAGQETRVFCVPTPRVAVT